MSLHDHTPEPWCWYNRSLHGWDLVAPHHGHLIIMDCVRRGMNGAQLRFARRSDAMGGIMVKADEWGDLAQHPDARRIVACVNACAGLRTEDLENCAKCEVPHVRIDALSFFLGTLSTYLKSTEAVTI